jgi:hypothetical protein
MSSGPTQSVTFPCANKSSKTCAGLSNAPEPHHFDAIPELGRKNDGASAPTPILYFGLYCIVQNSKMKMYDPASVIKCAAL